MTVEIIPVAGLPEVAPGDDLAVMIADATALRDGDIVAVASKVVAKSEGAVASLEQGADADHERRRLARETAAAVVADTPSVLIVRTHHGFVCANGGIDASNTAQDALVLLPRDPDDSARRLRRDLRRIAGVDVGVIVTDTFGRPWREGQTDVAVGVAGVAPIRDERGALDRAGAALTVTQVAVADELAAAADLVRRKAEGIPVVVVRGLRWEPQETARATALVRAHRDDLFARGRGMLATTLTVREWPAEWERGPTREELAAVVAVAPSAMLAAQGPPASLEIDDAFEAGLAAAVLADHGLVVRWRRGGAPDAVTVEAGLPATGR